MKNIYRQLRPISNQSVIINADGNNHYVCV